jgi:peptide deformylase
MAVLEVLHFPDARLRKKAVVVDSIDDRIRQLAADMIETMYAENGIGLAATQVNVQKRVIVIDLSLTKNDAVVLINPEIVAVTGLGQMQEGCLSVPEIFETVERAEKITYRYLSLENKVVEQEAEGLLAVCIQHEIDHLNGKLFIDYLSPLKRGRIAKKLEKQEKLEAQAL